MIYILIIIAVVIFIFLALHFFQERFIFVPEKLSDTYTFNLNDGDSEVFLHTSDDAVINGILFKAHESKGVVLYFHGNAGSLAEWQDIGMEMTSFGYDLFIIDYRSFGKSRGKLSEEGLFIDAITAYNFLLEQGYTPNKIVIYGRSLGSGIAVDLVTKVKARCLILETPFSSMVKLANQLYPYLFPGMFLRYQFNNLEKAKQIKIPVLIIHGDSDRIIPLGQAKDLFKAFNTSKDLIIIPNGDHNNLSEFELYQKSIAQFLGTTSQN